MSKTVCTSGYFNPLHKGHLALFRGAKKLGQLTVIVNNDEQVALKGSVPFMDQNERMEIVSAIKYVDHTVLSLDKDRTVIETLKYIKPDIFVKGGDSTYDNVPEIEICNKLGIEIIFLPDKKIQSSSWLKEKK